MSGCGGETTAGHASDSAELDAALASELRRQFPDRAAQVLEQADAFAATNEGFALRTPSVALTLPRAGSDWLRFVGFGGVEVRVREIGTAGEAVKVERAVAYRRAGGTSFWTVAPGGAEEWLHLEAAAVRRDEAVASWQVEGATVRQRNDGVEIVDTGGVVRLSVTAPVAYAAGGREIDVRLVASGAQIDLRVDASGEAVLVDPAWVIATPMTNARHSHSATRLQNGKVLVVSGIGSGGSTSTVELYDPTTNTWSPAASMGPRRNHTATLLPNGTVLAAAGAGGNGAYLASADLYNPVTNTWSSASSMSGVRSRHAAALLPNGKVLVAGGWLSNGFALATANLYDPATNTWSSAAAMSQGRGYHTATLLPNGKVLVAGGTGSVGNGLVAPSELYDPATNTWTVNTPMLTPRLSHTATLLSSGKVLVAGGAPAAAELYDPTTNTWSPAGSLSLARSEHTATLLPSGNVLITGGYGPNNDYLASVEMYDPTTNTWSPAGSLTLARSKHTATLLDNGEVLVAGGDIGFPVPTVELFQLTPLGSTCALAGDCQSGFCVDGVCCNTACNAGTCDACSISAGAPMNGTCALLTGPACNDGNACTQTDTCQAGVCTGGGPVTCVASDQCHVAGVCNPATGMCSNPAQANGASCDDGNGCSLTDTCQAGVCTGANPVTCNPSDQCHVAGVCNPATGLCSNPATADGTACTDGSLCTQVDTCQAGACVGASAVVCPPPDQCHASGVCNSATGVCTNPAKPDSSACDDGNPCTQSDTCQTGICTGSDTVKCVAVDACHDAGQCDAATGICTNPAKPDSAVCDDGNPCTQSDTCQAGICISGDTVKCVALDTCHVAGQCDATTGNCTNPAKPDTAVCDDGNGCTQLDTCKDGVCQGANPMECEPLDECHDAGTCDPASGVCTNPAKPDGTACVDGKCNAGVCIGGGTGGSAGSGGTTGGQDGGGCGCRVDPGPATGELWVGLGMLLAVLRRRRTPRAKVRSAQA